MIELGPRETGNTLVGTGISGLNGEALLRGKSNPRLSCLHQPQYRAGPAWLVPGTLSYLDEIAHTDFTDTKSFVSIMKGCTQDAKISRGKKEILAVRKPRLCWEYRCPG